MINPENKSESMDKISENITIDFKINDVVFTNVPNMINTENDIDGT